MRGPFRLEIKSPTDPTKKLPINVVVDVKRGTITCEDVKKILGEIRQQGIHLRIVLTDKNPHPEALEDIRYIPQAVLIIVEHRDLVKLLTISLAKIKGVEVDSSLLLRVYKDLIDKFALRNHLEKWVERMTSAGYLLTCEGFVDKTAQACRFFINSVGKPLSIQESWEYSWNLRNLLPFGIRSEMIPDMGIEELKRYVEVLKGYGFLSEENGKYLIRQHPTEDRIIELLEHYGKMTAKSTLAKHFVFREAMLRIFDSILEHMERKMLIQERHGNIHLMTLHDVKSLREKVIRDFEEYKKSLNQIGLSFANILTWKEREWHIIPLTTMENVIEGLLKEIAITDNQDIIRSRTFIVKELIEWYGHYVRKAISSFRRSSEIATSLSLEVNNVQRRFNEIFESIVRSTKATHLQIKLQELNEITSELEEVKEMLTSKEQLDVLENQIEQIAGSKKSRNPIRTDKLWTDVDEEMRANEGVKGEWTVAKYLLVKKKMEDIQKRVNDVNITLDSLDKLSQEMVDIANKFLKIFSEITVAEKEKLSSSLIDISKQIAESRISRSPFPSNISVLTITELHQAIEGHAEFLQNEIKRAEDAKENINLLSNVEKDFVKTLEMLELLEGFYEKFWEEDVPKDLISKRIEISDKYKQISKSIQNETVIFNDFNEVVDRCKAMQTELLELSGRAKNLLNQYEKLFENIKQYLTVGSMFVKRFKERIAPKLVKSDKDGIKKWLESLTKLYDDSLSWIKMMLENILQKSLYISSLPITRTAISGEERKLKENLIKEIKDLNEHEALVLMKIIEFSACRRSIWLPLTETCMEIAQEVNMPPDEVKRIILTISEKGFTSLAIGL
jgi:hypothetical protein